MNNFFHLKKIFIYFLGIQFSMAFTHMVSASTSYDPIIHLNNQGSIQGYIDNDLAIFKGIPYAAPPVNSYRWLPPQPVQPWEGIKKTIEYGPSCNQSLNRWDKKEDFPKLSEDCLYLNIWMPASSYFQSATKEKYPVMVWIHGGGFVSGGSSQKIYDGSALAKQGIIVVTINYRLGRFGFYAHPALQKENEENKWANYGIMDQIAALQWVQKNITEFGGDIHNITLFGESAGGASIITLMTIKDAQGLFNKAIIQSGTGHSSFFPPKSLKNAEKNGINFANKKNIPNDEHALEKLRKLPSDDIVDQLNLNNLQTDYFSGLIIDGNLLKQSLDDAFKKGEFYPVPTLIGDTDGDGFLILKTALSDLARKMNLSLFDINKVYNSDRKQSETKILRQLIADIQILEPTYILTQQLAHKNIPVYRYRFSYIVNSARPYTSYGAPHASEIPFIFGTLDKAYSSLVPQDIAMSEAIKNYWVSFAKISQPKVKGLTDFPDYKSYPDKLLHFTNKGILFEPDPFQSRLEFIGKNVRNKSLYILNPSTNNP